MERLEKEKLEEFMRSKTPYDFQCGIYNTLLIDSLMGLVHQTLKGKKLKKEYINEYEISDEDMPMLKVLSEKKIENKVYFQLISDCFEIIKKYSI